MHRLGVIIPSSNTTIEQEFSATPYGSSISLHIARIPLSNVTVEGLSAMEEETEAAARLLKDADVDAIAYACTSGSLIKGVGQDAALAKKIFRVVNCPVVVTSTAVVNALKKLGAHKIALATPYIEEINKKEVDFLFQSGFEVVNTQALCIKENLKIGRLTADDAVALATRADSCLADAVFISCTNFATFNAISKLETKLKKPVISSNSATLWAALNALHLKGPMQLGKLFGV
jgi:maleate isomerase